MQVCLPLCSSDGLDLDKTRWPQVGREAEDSEGGGSPLGPELDYSLQSIMEPKGHVSVPIPTQLCRVV